MSTFDDPTKAILKPRVEGESLKVAETVLRRRDRNIEAKGKRAERIAKQKKIRGTVKTKRTTPPEKLIKLSKKRMTDRRRLKRIENQKNSKVAKMGKILYVQRNRRPGGSDKTKEVLRELRIMSFNHGVFLPNTVEILDKLKVIAPFVVWGNPCFEVVNDMLHKSAFITGKKKAPVRLSDNGLIEEHLGEQGMFCVEDLVNEIFTNGPNCEEVCNKLRPFQLGDFTDRQAKGFVREQDIPWGNLKFKINDRIREFLGNQKEKDAPEAEEKSPEEKEREEKLLTEKRAKRKAERQVRKAKKNDRKAAEKKNEGEKSVEITSAVVVEEKENVEMKETAASEPTASVEKKKTKKNKNKTKKN